MTAREAPEGQAMARRQAVRPSRFRERVGPAVRLTLVGIIVAAPPAMPATAQEPAAPLAGQDSAPPAVTAPDPSAAPSAPANRSGLSEAELDDLTARVAAQLRCLVCRNQSVLESPTELAREMQSVIRERLAAGETPEEVKQYFVRTYGEYVLLLPEPKGVNLFVYLLPAAGLLAGLIVLVVALRRWSARGTVLSAEAGPASSRGAESEVAREEPAREEGSPTDGGDILSEKDRSWLESALRDG